MADAEPIPARRSCKDCGDAIAPRSGRGRPRLRCGVCAVKAPRCRSAKRYRHKCQECGGSFESRQRRAVVCSPACWAVRARRQQSARGADHSRLCRRCGLVFTPPRSSDPGHYCSRACAAEAKRIYPDEKAAKRAEHARRRQRLGLPPVETDRRCEICGDEFHSSWARLTCSETCAAEMAKRRAAGECTKDQRPRPCKECGVTFAPFYGDKRRIYCSATCSRRSTRRECGHKHRSRARARGVPYEPIQPHKVFERDGWRCQVCGTKTPKRLRGTLHSRAPELDHRIPLAMGGGHVWGNVQCTCRKCNAAKRGIRIVGQMPLFDRPA
jgi:hypothetical protein